MLKANKVSIGITIACSIITVALILSMGLVEYLVYSILVLSLLSIILFIELMRERTVGPIKSACEDNTRIIEALVHHIKATDKENLYQGSELEKIVNETLCK